VWFYLSALSLRLLIQRFKENTGLFIGRKITLDHQLLQSGRWVAWILAFDITWIAGTPLAMMTYASELNILGHVLLASIALWVTVFAVLERY
jgi:hypothetical protein